MAVKNCFIRGSVVRYVQLPAEHVDTQLLEDATRRGLSVSSLLHISACHTSNSCFGSRGGEPGQAVISPQTDNASSLVLNATAGTSGPLGLWGSQENPYPLLNTSRDTSHRKHIGNCILDHPVDQRRNAIGKMNVKRVTRDQTFEEERSLKSSNPGLVGGVARVAAQRPRSEPLLISAISLYALYWMIVRRSSVIANPRVFSKFWPYRPHYK